MSERLTWWQWVEAWVMWFCLLSVVVLVAWLLVEYPVPTWSVLGFFGFCLWIYLRGYQHGIDDGRRPYE